MSHPQTVCITGAGRGVGLELTRRYLERGDRVLAGVRSPETADALAQLSGDIEIHRLDVVDEASLAAFSDRLAGAAIDVVIANAGVLFGWGGLEDPAYTAESWRETLMVNVFGPFATAQALAPNLCAAAAAGRAPRLAIIASRMGSTAEVIGKGNSYSYRASKAAAVNLARNLAAELKSKGVAVGAYHPGWVRTDMGGAGADISVEESAAGLMARFDALTLARSGVFEDYLGASIAY
ncbi:MAG: SDR family NAD(P)-dependent oxidoreductase [Neomegalonema sp.]|nr:SDR family NAD(P)-dependent oxidoreductase [Neomegalonema sp.]